MLDEKSKMLKHYQKLLNRNRLRYWTLWNSYEKVNADYIIANTNTSYMSSKVIKRRDALIKRKKALLCLEDIINFWGWKVAQVILADPKLKLSQIRVKKSIYGNEEKAYSR